MMRQRFLQMARSRNFSQDVVRGFTLAECRGGKFALHGADRRSWGCGSTRVMVLCRLCTGLDWFNGLPRLLNRLS